MHPRILFQAFCLHSAGLFQLQDVHFRMPPCYPHSSGQYSVFSELLGVWLQQHRHPLPSAPHTHAPFKTWVAFTWAQPRSFQLINSDNLLVCVYPANQDPDLLGKYYYEYSVVSPFQGSLALFNQMRRSTAC